MLNRLILACLVSFTAICGCATATTYDADGKPLKSVTSYGAFRDIVHTVETIKPDGTAVRETLSSKSTTSDLMRASNEILGTVSGVAAKVAP